MFGTGFATGLLPAYFGHSIVHADGAARPGVGVSLLVDTGHKLVHVSSTNRAQLRRGRADPGPTRVRVTGAFAYVAGAVSSAFQGAISGLTA